MHHARTRALLQVVHKIYSLDSHRVALYLESKAKLLPLVQVRAARVVVVLLRWLTRGCSFGALAHVRATCGTAAAAGFHWCRHQRWPCTQHDRSAAEAIAEPAPRMSAAHHPPSHHHPTGRCSQEVLLNSMGISGLRNVRPSNVL